MSACPVCGFTETKRGKSRSIDQHRRFFAIVSASFDHIPEDYERQFANVTEWRKFLEMKVGWREIGAQIPLTGVRKENAMMLAEAAIRGAGSYAVAVIHRDTLVIFRPRSISFTAMPHLEFNRLAQAVEDLIRDIIGVEPEQLLKERERAVA